MISNTVLLSAMAYNALPPGPGEQGTGIFPLLACSRSARVVSLVCLVRGSQFWPVLTVT